MTSLENNKMKKSILVVKSNILYQAKSFKGFLPHREFNLEKIILDNYEYQERGLMEQDLSYQQPIPYAIVVNKNGDIVTYQRGNNKSNNGEIRLASRWSIGVGGHVEISEKDCINPLYETILKEVEEEISVSSILSCELLGYINDDSSAVEDFHVGVVYLVTIDNDYVDIVDGEMQSVYLKSKDEINTMMLSNEYNMEPWSRILRNYYKDQF